MSPTVTQNNKRIRASSRLMRLIYSTEFKGRAEIDSAGGRDLFPVRVVETLLCKNGCGNMFLVLVTARSKGKEDRRKRPRKQKGKKKGKLALLMERKLDVSLSSFETPKSSQDWPQIGKQDKRLSISSAPRPVWACFSPHVLQKIRLKYEFL